MSLQLNRAARQSPSLSSVLAPAALGLCLLMGLAAVADGVQALIRGDLSAGGTGLVFVTGLVAFAVGAGFLYLEHVQAGVETRSVGGLASRASHQPWMLRAGGAERRVIDRSRLAVAMFM
ncbi:unnamed protein product, partial [Phaeothamnion confervicola]